jgi:hypothetical protein
VFLAAIDAMARIRARRLASATQAEAAGAEAAGAEAAGAEAAGAEAAGAEAPETEAPETEDEAAAPPLAPARRPHPAVALLERHGAAAMLAIAVALAFQFPLSQLWTPQTYITGPHVQAAREAMARVPNGASVATDLDLLAPLAARTDTYWLGNFGSNPATTYVVFDTASTDWQPPPTNVLKFVESLNHGVRYRQIFVDDGVYVFIRSGA